MSGERQPLGETSIAVVVFVTTFVSGLLLRGSGLGWWAQLAVQMGVLSLALLGWYRWRGRT